MPHKFTKVFIFNFLALFSFIGVVGNLLANDEQFSEGKTSCHTQTEMNLKASDEYKRIEKDLNTIYKKIKSEYQNNLTLLKKLQTSQQTWLKLREARLDAHFPLKPGEDGQSVYGSGYFMDISKLLTKMTLERIDQLANWLEDAPEGEICTGSAGKQS